MPNIHRQPLMVLMLSVARFVRWIYLPQFIKDAGSQSVINNVVRIMTYDGWAIHFHSGNEARHRDSPAPSSPGYRRTATAWPQSRSRSAVSTRRVDSPAGRSSGGGTGGASSPISCASLPRTAITGTIHAGTLTYSNTVRLVRPAMIKARAKQGDVWSALAETPY